MRSSPSEDVNRCAMISFSVSEVRVVDQTRGPREERTSQSRAILQSSTFFFLLSFSALAGSNPEPKLTITHTYLTHPVALLKRDEPPSKARNNPFSDRRARMTTPTRVRRCAVGVRWHGLRVYARWVVGEEKDGDEVADKERRWRPACVYDCGWSPEEGEEGRFS
jgi:hypothetical protein